MDQETISRSIIEKLTKEELAFLMDAWENGSLDGILADFFIPVDQKNRPGVYVEGN